MAMGPIYVLPNTCETRIDVGPSAAPMMPMEAASTRLKPIKVARLIVAKMPHWAAAPKRMSFGLANSGPKSIIAPMPMKSSSGMASAASMPRWKSQSRMPGTSPMPTIIWVTAPLNGRLTRIAPNPMGSNNEGSSFFAIAR